MNNSRIKCNFHRQFLFLIHTIKALDVKLVSHHQLVGMDTQDAFSPLRIQISVPNPNDDV